MSGDEPATAERLVQQFRRCCWPRGHGEDEHEHGCQSSAAVFTLRSASPFTLRRRPGVPILGDDAPPSQITVSSARGGARGGRRPIDTRPVKLLANGRRAPSAVTWRSPAASSGLHQSVINYVKLVDFLRNLMDLGERRALGTGVALGAPHVHITIPTTETCLKVCLWYPPCTIT